MCLVTDPRHKKEQTIGGLPGPSGVLGSCSFESDAVSLFAMCVSKWTAVKPRGIILYYCIPITASQTRCSFVFCSSLVPLQGLQTVVRNKCVEKLVSVLAAALRVFCDQGPMCNNLRGWEGKWDARFAMAKGLTALR